MKKAIIQFLLVLGSYFLAGPQKAVPVKGSAPARVHVNAISRPVVYFGRWITTTAALSRTGTLKTRSERPAGDPQVPSATTAAQVSASSIQRHATSAKRSSARHA